MSFLGIYLFLKGITGKSSFLIEGYRISAKLTNAAPGAIICLLGAFIIFFSLHTNIQRIVTSTPLSGQDVLNQWLENSYKLNGDESYLDIIKIIRGPFPEAKLISETKKINRNTFLGEIAKEEYGDPKFWHLLAAINQDHGYFSLDSVNELTPIKEGSFLEIWHVSKFYGMDTTTIIRMAGKNKERAYDEILALIEGGKELFKDIRFEELSDYYKKQELSLAIGPIDSSSGATTLRELSLKYYGNVRCWEIIAWANRDRLPANVSESTNITGKSDLLIIYFLP
jgi:hypothetical protein